MFDFETMWREEKPFADRLARWIDHVLKPNMIVDIGCGPGMFVQAFRERGLTAWGCDIDDYVVGKPHLSQVSMFDLHQPADLVTCIEVAEHINTGLSDEIAKSMWRNVTSGGNLIWSAAHPGQGGVGHINCQTKEYWQEKLEAQGFVRDYETEDFMLEYIRGGYHMGWFRMNAMFFRKR
jgi:2-polyprenyl-3-methyl-5-hydroxy-6-metoxy-1,4-benzoquinol methylase